MRQPSETLGAPAPAFELPEVEAEPVFVVEDDTAILRGIGRVLTQVGYDVREFEAPTAALALVREGFPKVLVTDLDMPGMTGLELARRALEVDSDIKVVIVTGAGHEAAAQAALRIGVTDYVTKPLDLAELVGAVQRAFLSRAQDEYMATMDEWLREEVRRQTATIRQVTLGTLESLLNVIEARSPYFEGHSRSVAESAAAIATRLGMEQGLVSAVHTAGLLHDIGMIAVPDAVVSKPGGLSDGEYRVVKDHCRRGAAILGPMEHLEPAVTFVLEHHERLDGTGYPHGKKGSEISLGGQVLALAEAWTALTEERPYRDRMSNADALATLGSAAGLWYSAELIGALRSSLS
jgi:response regulator RpfG family c-di-GMP phosphodiesterase